jgi:lipopolysaccharide/colanic/teichoic acid biosynthesis glycosyltransferase
MPEPLTLIGVGGGIVGLVLHLARRYFDAAKEVFDAVCGVILLVISLPLMLVCAAIIKLSSPKGPVLFKQVRVGKDGKLFTMYKLRSMHMNAESSSGAVWAAKDDPRVIRGCKWMRRSHVDELPQLVNIIKGEMSLVGPRPERLEILEELEKAYPNVRNRLAVKPGITGLAQIRNGYDSSIDAFRGKLASDLEYIDQRKWSLEIRILFSTVTKFNDQLAR